MNELWILWVALGFSIGNLVAYAIGGTMHITIAARMLMKEAARSRAEYRRMIELELLPTAEKHILDGVKQIVPEGPAQIAIPQESLDQIATAVGKNMELRVSSKAGAAARTAQTSLEKIIRGISTGNVYVDGLLNMADADGSLRNKYARAIATAIRKSGLDALGGPPNGSAEDENSGGIGPDNLGPEWH